MVVIQELEVYPGHCRYRVAVVGHVLHNIQEHRREHAVILVTIRPQRHKTRQPQQITIHFPMVPYLIMHSI